MIIQYLAQFVKILTKKSIFCIIYTANTYFFRMNKQYSFSELSAKRTINVAEGCELGHVCDVIFSANGRVNGIVVPGKKSIFKSFTNSENVFIPWCNIIKIGSDVILVELIGNAAVCAENDEQE